MHKTDRSLPAERHFVRAEISPDTTAICMQASAHRQSFLARPNAPALSECIPGHMGCH